MEERICERGEF